MRNLHTMRVPKLNRSPQSKCEHVQVQLHQTTKSGMCSVQFDKYCTEISKKAKIRSFLWV